MNISYNTNLLQKARDNQLYFKQLSNSHLKGNTFDAKHIDQILVSESSAFNRYKADLLRKSSNKIGKQSPKSTKNPLSQSVEMTANPMSKHKMMQPLTNRGESVNSQNMTATNVRFSSSFMSK